MNYQQGERCHSNGIRGFGNPDEGVMILGISPGHEELKLGKPMVGQSGKLTDAILAATGWHRDKVYATNICCYPRDEPTFQEIMSCRPRLLGEVDDFKPKLIVLLGRIVSDLFFPNRKFGSVRGSLDWYAPWATHVLPTYHPAAILHGASEIITRGIVRDFSKISSFFSAPPRPTVTFSCVSDPLVAQQVMDALPSDRFIALDIEAFMDKDEDGAVAIEEKVACFSISDGAQTWWFPGELATQIKWRTDLQWTYHNGAFDTISLAETIGVLLPIKHDTMLMSYALDERGGIHKLKTLAREYEGAGFYEDSPHKKWKDKLADTEWTRTYNAKDAAYTARLASRLHANMQADNVLGVYNNLLIPAANTYRLMQRNGIFVNKERYKQLASEWIPLLYEKEAALKKQVAQLGGDPDINLGSPKQLGNFLYGTLRLPGGPSTAAPIIEELADGLEPGNGRLFIHALIDLRHLEKAVNTYLVGAWDDIKNSGRIHPSPLIHGTVGGRCSYSPYAINTLPRSTSENPYLSRIRWLFTAPDDDHILLEIDYSQAEIWTAYMYCEDEQMGADLRSGDFHTKSAQFVYQVEKPTDEQRSDGKRTTFGMFYGIGDEKLGKQTNKSTYEAGVFKQRWNARYPGYQKYKTRVIREAEQTGEIVTKTGRKRRFPLMMDHSYDNAIINFKIQSTAHDYLMSSIIEAYPVVDSMGGQIWLDGHDANLMCVKKSNVREVAIRVKEIMESERFPGLPSIPAEAKIGFSWGEMTKLRL